MDERLMRSVADWLGEYGASHQNPTNELLHWICVPLIVLSLFGLLWSLPVPAVFASVPWLNWATLMAAAALAYYLMLSPILAIGILISFVVLLLITQWLTMLPWPLWLTSSVIFVTAWIGQFFGHAVEGRRPSFFKDVQFLLIGPLWLLAAAYRRLGLSY
ncbi:MAG TPA: Mpo1-like protein [Steroidobacteraceae bacterium]|nr:Mpo1-like protein [Steroidobacteraceae bacterium]